VEIDVDRPQLRGIADRSGGGGDLWWHRPA
jgi:hypothetical protein